MNIIDSVVALLSPKAAYERTAYRMALAEQEKAMAYDAAGYDRLNRNWHVRNEPAEWADQADRDTVRARAWDMERNSDIMNSIVSAYKRNVYGAGYRLRAVTDNSSMNQELEKLWQQWCKKQHCDVSGTQGFKALMRMAVERKKIDGGIIILKCYTDDEFLPLKLQLIEVDMLDDMAQAPRHAGNRVSGGIELDRYNKPVGYFLRQYSQDGMQTDEVRYYDAKDVIFYYTRHRPTQIREMSDMAPSIPRIRDVTEFFRALSVKERIMACLSVFITKELPVSTGRINGGGAHPDREYQGKTLTQGMINYLNPGDKVNTVQPSGQSADAAQHIKQQLKLLGSGQGLSYEATSRDMSESNYSSARQGAIEDELTYEEDVEQLMDIMDEIYETFVISAWLRGYIQAADFWPNKQAYFRHEWKKPPKKWIDPVKETNANKIALSTGQKTYADMAAENGRDWREQIDEIAEVQEYARARGVSIGEVNGNGS